MKWFRQRKAKENKPSGSLQLNSPSQSKGGYYEQLAREYLEQQGLSCIKQNFRCKLGEIDLIMQDKHYLIFVEVRYRKSEQYGGAVASISYDKQQKLVRAASFYLSHTQQHNRLACRFDVVTFNQNKPNWIQSAFDAEPL